MSSAQYIFVCKKGGQIIFSQHFQEQIMFSKLIPVPTTQNIKWSAPHAKLSGENEINMPQNVKNVIHAHHILISYHNVSST